MLLYISQAILADRKPLWRNWQTHTTQNRTGNHMGSSPISGIRKWLFVQLSQIVISLKKIEAKLKLREFSGILFCLRTLF